MPRPAWYFYFLFQILEWAKGPIFVPIGTVWLPTIAILALLLIPVYDRNKNHRITKRPLAILFFYGSMLFIVVVTAYNVITAPAEPTKNNENHAPVQQPAAPQGDLPAAVVSW
ncbi:MAG: hypothetical protein M1118_09470 [Chloroflexi bacterium]|nr:hypothetical protein [Chloroflexota bacterium]